MIHRCLLLLSLLLAPVLHAADDDTGWVSAAKARSPEDISLWTRTIPGQPLKAFRGATYTATQTETLLAMLYDTDSMQHWIFRCKDARILAEQPNGDIYVHMRINGIWPLTDRDAVMLVRATHDAKTGEILFSGYGAPDYIPEQPGFVRIRVVASTWRLTPTPEGLLRVEWTGHVDPAGNVPLWLANTLGTLVPRYTLRSMRELLKEPRWQTAEQRELGARLLARIKAQPAPR